MPPYVIAFIVVLVVYFLGTEGLKKYFDMKIQASYSLGLYDECIEVLDRRLARMLMTTFKQYYMRFVVYEAQGNAYAAGKMLDHLLNMHASKKQRTMLVGQAFNFYVMGGKRKRAEEMLAEVKGSGDAALAADCQLTYDIVFGGRHDQIERMEGMLSTNDPNLRGKLYLLLQHQYQNIGDRKKAQYYKGLLRELKEANSAPKPSAATGAQQGE